MHLTILRESKKSVKGIISNSKHTWENLPTKRNSNSDFKVDLLRTGLRRVITRSSLGTTQGDEGQFALWTTNALSRYSNPRAASIRAINGISQERRHSPRILHLEVRVSRWINGHLRDRKSAPVGTLLAFGCFVVVLHKPVVLNSMQAFCCHIIVAISCLCFVQIGVAREEYYTMVYQPHTQYKITSTTTISCMLIVTHYFIC